MAVFQTWLKSDLKKPLEVKQLKGNLYSGDDESNIIGVEVFDGGEIADLTGDVYGYIIRDDDDTVIVQDTLDGNKASIVLPETAYAVAGRISVVIKVGGTTVCACVGNVYKAVSDTIADPDNIIPSVEELLQRISDALDAADTAEDSAETAVDAAETAVGAKEDVEEYALQIIEKLITSSTSFSIPATGNTVAYNMATITAKHELIRWNFSVSSENEPPADLEWTTYDGYFTIKNNNGVTSETMKPMFGIPLEKAITVHT